MEDVANVQNTRGMCPPSTCTPCETPRRKADALCPSEIFKRFGDAAVTMRTVPKFRVFWQNYNNMTDQLNPGSHYNAGVAPVSHSGFFMNKGFIVSSIPFTIILLLAALFFTFIAAFCWRPGVTAEQISAVYNQCCQSCTPPNASNLTNKYESLPGFVEVMRGICSGQSFADFFEFYAEVFNVNGCGENFIYRAYLVGLDFSTGVGIYRIEACDPWNKCLPLIKKQKYLIFASSKCYTPGNTVHTVADLRCTGSRSYSSGVVVDNANVSRQGDVTYETIATNMDIGRGAEGAPILNDCGYVVGIVTAMSECCHALGVSSSFITRVIDAIIDAACHVEEQGPGCANEHALYIDLFGCIVYRHGSINWNFRGKTALDLNQLFLQKTVSAPACAPCAPCPDTGAHPFMKPTECDPCCGWEGLENRFYNDNTCRINRELMGIIIDCEPCGQLADVVEECQRSSPNWGKGCSEYYQIEKGDVVTHLNGVPLGTLPHQNTPDNILYSLSACDCVELKFQKANEMFTNCHALKVRLEDSICWIGDFKPIVTKCLPADSMNPSVDDTPSCFLSSWLHFVFWWLNAVPQVYRAVFFTNLSGYMLKLNACLNSVMYKTLLPDVNENAYPDNLNFDNGSHPPDPNGADIGPLAQALVSSNISRDTMACIAKPSLSACYVPCSFIDFISSFQHPTSYECFKQTIPDYLQMKSLVCGLNGGDNPDNKAAAELAWQSCISTTAAEIGGDPNCFVSVLGDRLLGLDTLATSCPV